MFATSLCLHSLLWDGDSVSGFQSARKQSGLNKMGFFRRYKLSDYTADECREKMEQLMCDIWSASDYESIEKLMEQWACFRELLARHEKRAKGN